jgi:hypothetical protein
LLKGEAACFILRGHFIFLTNFLNSFEMKKAIYSFIASFYFMATAQAQCPISITTTSGGNVYHLLLTDISQCANFPSGSTKTINGQNYGVAACDDDSGDPITSLTVVGGGTPLGRGVH